MRRKGHRILLAVFLAGGVGLSSFPLFAFATDFPIPPILPYTVSGNTYDHYAAVRSLSNSYIVFFSDSAYTPCSFSDGQYSGVGSCTVGSLNHIGTASSTVTGFNGNPYLWTNSIGNGKIDGFSCSSVDWTSCTENGNYNFIGNAVGTGGAAIDFSSDMSVVDYSGGQGYTPSVLTHILSVVPMNGTTTATSTIIGSTVLINPNVLSSSSDTDPFNPQIEIDINGIDTSYSTSFFFPSASKRIISSGTQTFSASTTLQDGLYSMHTVLSVPPFGQYPGQIYDSTTTSFTVNQSSISALTQASASSTIAQPPVANCSISDLSGCFQNALVYLFWPTQSGLNTWGTFKTLIYQKAPVGYFAMVQTSLNGATTTMASAITGWNISSSGLMSGIFTPLRTAIAGILWFWFLVHFFRRLQHIDI